VEALTFRVRHTREEPAHCALPSPPHASQDQGGERKRGGRDEEEGALQASGTRGCAIEEEKRRGKEGDEGGEEKHAR
jgi:hypothetical protein